MNLEVIRVNIMTNSDTTKHIWYVLFEDATRPDGIRECASSPVGIVSLDPDRNTAEKFKDRIDIGVFETAQDAMNDLCKFILKAGYQRGVENTNNAKPEQSKQG